MKHLVLLTLVLLGAATSASAAPEPPSLQDEAAHLVRTRLPDGTTSIYVADLATGRPLVAIASDAALNPASNVKLIATATALDLLGPDFRFSLWLWAVAPTADGSTGDLFLTGDDPTLESADLVAMAANLQALGVRTVDGDVVVGRSDRDAGDELSVAVEGRGDGRTRVTIGPASSEVVLHAHARTTRTGRSNIRITASWIVDRAGRRRVRIEVAGVVRTGEQVIKHIAVPDPAPHVASILLRSLRDAGVHVSGRVRVQPFRDYVSASLAAARLPLPLVDHRSAPLAEIVARVNKHSVNWLADAIVIAAASADHRSPPTMATAVAAMRRWLCGRARVDVRDVVLDTGSGLSYQTKLSTRQIVATLTSALHDGFGDSLAVAGVDGTLARRLGDLRERVTGKTGTLTGVVAFSGILELDDGQTIVFSIVTNGHRRGLRAAVRRAHDDLVRLVARRLGG